MSQSFAEQTEHNFRANVRRYRERIRMTQAELAQRLSEQGFAFHAQTIYKIERGERQLRLNEAVAVARALEVELGFLVDDPARNEVLEVQKSLEAVVQDVFDAAERYEELQYMLAFYADLFGLDPNDEDNRALRRDLGVSIEDVLKEYRRYAEADEAGKESRLKQLAASTPGLTTHEVSGARGPFVNLLRSARGEHQEEA